MALPKLLWLTENYPPQRGGMAQSCDRIIHGLRQVGYSIEIIHFTNRGQPLKRKQQQQGGYSSIPYEDSESHVLNVAWNYVQTLEDFDYIICFGGYLSMIGAPIFSMWSGKPLVTFLRGNDFDASIFTPRKRGILQDVLSQSQKVFSVSTDKVDKVNGWMPKVDAYYVPNGIDINQWQTTKSEEEFAQNWRKTNAKEKICLGLFGQLKPKKGSDLLLQALSRTNFVEQTHLFLIGDIDGTLEERLNVSGVSYSHLQFQDRYELIKYYLCCDAVVIPSFYDGMPNVMLEAGALGIPVIASDIDGMKDMLVDEIDGLLFQPGIEESCRKALYRFFERSAEQRHTLGENLKTKIHNQYTINHEIESYQQHIV